MGDKTGISWTDATWNPVRGCSRVSEGCRNCYAERVAARFSGPGQPYEGLAKIGVRTGHHPKWTGVVRLIPDHLADPIKWRRPRRIFVNSMSDLFHEELTNEEIAAVFGVMAACPRHTFQVLTKRAGRMREWFEWVVTQKHCHQFISPQTVCYQWAHTKLADRVMRDELQRRRTLMTVDQCKIWPLLNVWLGVSVENQEAADDRIPDLLATPATKRFLSCEPLLGPVDLEHVQHNGEFEVNALTGDHGVARPLAGRGARLDWVIVGCESGPRARSCDVEWVRLLRDLCASARVAFFLKQAAPARGGLVDGQRPFPIDSGVGSKVKAGYVIELPYLDGVQHTAFPEVRHGG